MGRAVAGKPPKGWEQRQRKLRRKRERRLRALNVPMASEAHIVNSDSIDSTCAGDEDQQYQHHQGVNSGDDIYGYQEYEGYDGQYEGFYYDLAYEPSSDEEQGTDAAADLALDVAHQFLFGKEWRMDIVTFLSEHAQVFSSNTRHCGKESDLGMQDDFSQEQHEAFCSFRAFAERRLETLLSPMGLTIESLAARCRRVLRTEGSKRREVAEMVVQSLLAVDSFASFARLCIDFEAIEAKNHIVDEKSPGSRQQQIDLGMTAETAESESPFTPQLLDCTVIFSRPGPLGLELAPRISGGGAIVKEIVLGSEADKAGVCRGFVVVGAAGSDVERMPLPEIVSLLVSRPRPIKVVFRRHGSKQASMRENTQHQSEGKSNYEYGQAELKRQYAGDRQWSSQHPRDREGPAMDPEQMHHMLDLPSDWDSLQIQIAEQLCRNKANLDEKERRELLPWANKALKLQKCRLGQEHCSAERILELRAAVFRARVRMDLHVAKKILESKSQNPEARSSVNVDLGSCLSKSQELESTIEKQRSLVLAEVRKLGFSEEKYGSIYLLLKNLLAAETFKDVNDGDDEDLNGIPQTCEGMMPLLMKLLCLEQQRDNLQMKIRRAVSGVDATSAVSLNKSEGRGGFEEKLNSDVVEKTRERERQHSPDFDDNDCFLQSIRFLKGSLGVSKLQMEHVPAQRETKASEPQFEDSMLQSHFL